jgi:hypothetical protein
MKDPILTDKNLMKDSIPKATLLEWLDKYASALIARGPIYGSFIEQEAIMSVLITMRDLVSQTNRSSPSRISNVARYHIAEKHKLLGTLAFNEQLKDAEQSDFSKILKDWWEFRC